MLIYDLHPWRCITTAALSCDAGRSRFLRQAYLTYWRVTIDLTVLTFYVFQLISLVFILKWNKRLCICHVGPTSVPFNLYLFPIPSLMPSKRRHKWHKILRHAGYSHRLRRAYITCWNIYHARGILSQSRLTYIMLDRAALPDAPNLLVDMSDARAVLTLHLFRLRSFGLSSRRYNGHNLWSHAGLRPVQLTIYLFQQLFSCNLLCGTNGFTWSQALPQHPLKLV
jgi:hypothetical protein